ncbi:hypothetical protein P153DRAFT_369137 [Dothidotthia symphoricarpi CBS 119687]|uniref:DUF1308 domain-containing protein n=1 Tax=Dothidotthia symphoricarpi CBS 119687 TaxID=1392245 RepID=A0A6A6A4E5_9PLEO|nr:uncharacterized protein P153DRAFT_369137 [Dothidotthia symphoricarpi CBS 119687]KAF2126416.1 hypothetical protein P153DRAFT_369137 [Dothidotthia symphoricarpi CBS 119687]
MAESIASSFSNLDLDTDATSVSNQSFTTDGTDPNSLDIEGTIHSLIDRCKTLYEEVETYVAAVEEKQKLTKVQQPVEYRNLRNDFKNELAFLRKIVGSKISEEKARHYITSSNLRYYEALWGTAKQSSGLQAFRKYYFWNRHERQAGKRTAQGISMTKGTSKKGHSAALVDIVAEEGREWVRVSTISEKRLLFDVAKLGWCNDSDSDEDMPDAPQPSNWEDEDDEDQVDIVKSARELARAARANPICGRPPKVRFVLTRILPGKTREIDNILDKLRATGAHVQCVNEASLTLPLRYVLPNLLVDRSRALSDTLNIDCTVLLALISDISHKPCEILDWYPVEVRAQIEEEAKENLLPTHLYPAIGSHAMVCTQEAADQMNLIVQTLATDTEKLRADLLLAQGDRAGRSPEQLVAEWSSMSDHASPAGFALPIEVRPSQLDSVMSRLPVAAAKLTGEMSALNQSIFFYGWAEGLTTLSSNRARARQIETAINEQGLQDGEAGPHIWLCGESRSLIAKTGRRR